MSTVMVVDDEERIRALLTRSLSTAGHQVITAATASAAIDRLSGRRVDLVLLDLVMPGSSGLDVLATLKHLRSTTPVIVLSGVTDVEVRVEALEHGAVDVVAKPFSLLELLARVRRHLPAGDDSSLAISSEMHERDRDLHAGGIRLDPVRRRAIFAGRRVSLTERESNLLAHLIHRRDQVCTKEELLRDVWHLDFDPGSNVVEVCVGRLRSKLGASLPVETVRGVGYCLYED